LKAGSEEASKEGEGPLGQIGVTLQELSISTSCVVVVNQKINTLEEKLLLRQSLRITRPEMGKPSTSL
jgi:hypothetical protein